MKLCSFLIAGAIALPLTLSLSSAAPTAVVVQKSINEQYHELAAAQDFDNLVALWKASEARVLSTIDRDLEGSLSVWETAKKADRDLTTEEVAKIAELHTRALFGARAASAAFGRPIFSDYAASFCSWNDQQKLDFRAGQAAFGDAVGAMGKGDFAAAQTAAERCTALAAPLGDWWGTAMGLGLSGAAKAAQDQAANALADLAQARLLNHGLGLMGSERSNLTAMLDILIKTESWQRALATCDALIGTPTEEQAASAEQKALAAARAEIIVKIG